MMNPPWKALFIETRPTFFPHFIFGLAAEIEKAQALYQFKHSKLSNQLH
jgi:hypothetical protein